MFLMIKSSTWELRKEDFENIVGLECITLSGLSRVFKNKIYFKCCENAGNNREMSALRA